MWSKSQLLKIKHNIQLAAASLSDAESLETPELFEKWRPDLRCSVGMRVSYNGKLYRCVQAHTSQSDWKPDITPALWVAVSVEEWAEWVQPTGAHDAYNAGDKVSHNNSHWVSTVNANVWEPGVYGWEKQ